MNLEILSKEEQKKENRKMYMFTFIVILFLGAYMYFSLFFIPSLSEQDGNERESNIVEKVIK